MADRPLNDVIISYNVRTTHFAAQFSSLKCIKTLMIHYINATIMYSNLVDKTDFKLRSKISVSSRGLNHDASVSQISPLRHLVLFIGWGHSQLSNAS